MGTARLRRMALGLALALGVTSIAQAQNATYPNHPIRMFVGFAAGGGTDVAARIMAQQMSKILGQSIVVENRTGASGLIAAQDLAKSDPDGYTLMMGSQTTCAVAPALYHKVTVDPVKDFSGVALTSASPLVLVVNPSFAAHSVADVIAMAKASPGKLNFGTGGVGTTPHMTAELFQHDAGIKMVHVAYRGEAGAINELGRGTGLPAAVSGQNSEWWWGPGNPHATTVVAVAPGPVDVTGYAAYLRQFFAHVRVAATLSNPDGIHNQEWGGHVYVCTGPRHPWAQLWPRLRHYD